MQTLTLATGIECSYPKVKGGKRRDQLEETRHYRNWREGLELCRQVGARFVHYGPPYYLMHTGPYIVFDDGKAIAGIAVALGITLAGRLWAKR